MKAVIYYNGKPVSLGGKLQAIAPAASNGTSSGSSTDNSLLIAAGGGGTTAPYTAPSLPPNTAATKYFATASKSVAAPNDAVVVSIEFNGIVPSSGTITPSGPGTCNPSTITLDGTNKTFIYTPSAVSATVEQNITFANSGSLYDSAPAVLNVYTASAGTAQGLAATLRLGDQAVHYRDVPTGKPTGFTTAQTQGWGEVWINLDRAVPALFARLYDRRSSGWSSAPGTGTELTSGWVQVYGATSAAKMVRLLLPAIRAKQLSIDLATDAIGTNPIRVTNCFAVGTVVMLTTRSQLTGYARGYAMSDTDSSGNHINKIVNWFMSCESVASAPQYGGDTSGTWARVAGEDYDPFAYKANQFYNEPTSNGTMEAGRLIDQQTGMMLGFTGVAYIGSGWQAYLADDGTPNASTLATCAAATGGKAHYWLLAGSNFDDRPDSDAAYSIVLDKAPDVVMRTMPTVHLVGICMGATGIYGVDGSRDYGYTRNQLKVVAREKALPHIVSVEDYHWNKFNNGHASQGARPPYVREHIRAFMSAERMSWGGIQTQNRGPELAPTGTRSGSIIRLSYKLNGASSLSAVIFDYPDLATFTVAPTSVASNLATLVAIYPQNGRAGDGVTTPLPISGVVINTANPPAGYDGTLDVTLSGAGPFAANLTAHFASDFGVSGGTGLGPSNTSTTVIVDNIDPFGVGYGQHMRPAIDILVVAAQ